MLIHGVPAFDDNLIWVLSEGDEALAIDPGEAKNLIEDLRMKELDLVAILLTHFHGDHIGGVSDLVNEFPDVRIYGPRELQSKVTQVVSEGDKIYELGETISVMDTRGHTPTHVSYIIDGNLFTGDALFLAGCGRTFTGDYELQFKDLQKFKELDGDLKVYPAHEYTVSNLRFAHHLFPDNSEIKVALDEAKSLRRENKPTMPWTLSREMKVNPFLQAEDLDTFIDYRKQKDNF